MASSTPLTQVAPDAIYPDMKSLKQANTIVRSTYDARRLSWILDGPLSSAIKVQKTPPDHDSPEPYCDTSSTPSKFHEISTSPFTEPKVSSIDVVVEPLTLWEDDWLEDHREHSEPDRDFCMGADALYGLLPEDTDGERQLLRCCGENRPIGKNVTLTVTPSDPQRGYVTVHDYVSVVHPWLLSLRENIVAAFGVLGHPVGPAKDFQVSPGRGDHIHIWDPTFMKPSKTAWEIVPAPNGGGYPFMVQRPL